MTTKNEPQRVTVTALALELIQSGGPITTADLVEEIHTLQRARVLVTDPGYLKRVEDALAFHREKKAIEQTPAGWVYTPPAGTTPKPRKPVDRQKGLGF